MAPKNRLPHIINDFILELEKQSKNPPNGDLVIKFCYQAITELMLDGEIRKYFENLITKREFTPSHFVNLLFRAIQYIEIFQIQNADYPSEYTSLSIWKKEIIFIINKHGELLSNLMLKRDTTTTVYQRYAGPKIVLNALFPNKKLTVGDFGCGGNYGLPGLDLNLEFRPIVDHTIIVSTLSLLEKPVCIMKGIAIDKEYPNDASAKTWRFACSFYPQELKRSTDMIDLETKIAQTKNVTFMKYNLTLPINENKKLSRLTFDVIIMSTFLYQLNQSDLKNVISTSKKLLNKDGILIIQDFAEKNTKNNKELIMMTNWFLRPYMYRTFVTTEATNWEMKEILQWQNGRCKEVQKGIDFDWFMQFTKQT